MEKLRLSKDVELPLDTITERLAFVGQSGSGKTYAAMRLAELMLEAGAQIVSLDPMGVWWGLLSAANGNASGYPVHVFGGAHAHVPIVPEAGALVAEVLVEKQFSAVVDLSHFTRTETVQFAIAFAERFFKLQVQVKRPVHVFFEEAQTFMPQNLPRGDSGGDPKKNPAVMLNRVELLVRQGRSQGVGCSMITQAPQAVAKSCLNQAGTLFAMRTMGKHERKAVGDWMADKATDDSQLKLDQLLPKLNTGDAWIASPNFLGVYQHTRVSKKTTFDSSATPKFGVRLEAPKMLAAVDVEALRESMKTVVETVEKDDPAPLRRRIAQLERELAAKPPAPAAQLVEVPALTEGDRTMFMASVSVIEKAARVLETERAELERWIVKLGSLGRPPTGTVVRPPTATDYVAQHRAANGHKWITPRSNGHALKLEGSGLKKGAREMLRELAALAPRSLTRRELATRVVMAHSGGSFGDYLSALRSAGYIEDDSGGDVRATDAGVKAAGAVAAKSCGEIVALWKGSSRLKKGARQMLDAVLGSTAPLTREQLAEAASMEVSGGSFGDYLSALRSAGCVDQEGKGFVAGHALFLGGQ